MRYLNPRGRSSYGIGICARCSKKFYLDQLHDDPNYPGLKVCDRDTDDFDPYRLPPREPDQITLEFVRPDNPLVVLMIPPIAPEDPGWPPADSVSPDGIIYLPGT